MKRLAALLGLWIWPCAAADWTQRIAAILADAPQGLVGLHVVDTANGQVLAAHNAGQLLLPASTLKLFTAALALTRLGPDYRFETRLLREPSGALVLVGAGDPTMSSRVYPYPAQAPLTDPLRALEDLVQQAIAAGLERVDGDVIGDDQRYLWSPYPDSWTADDTQHGYGAPVSALAFNDNTVTILLQPGTQSGAPARVSLLPGFEYFAVDNRVTTGAADAVRLRRVAGARQLLLSGTIRPQTRELRVEAAVDDPARFAVQALYDALQRNGIAVRGRPVARHRVTPEGAPAEGELLAVRRSPRLAEILETMVKVSQNLHAEMLLREVGAVRQGQGTVEGGLREMRLLLEELGIRPEEFVSEDGSGLARNDQVTPQAVTKLLTAMARGPQAEIWRSLFPVGGQDGTLSSRLCCASDAAAIRAKTGSLARSVALAGYADSQAHGRLAFAILVNNFTAAAAEVRAWVDRLATALVE
jgi:D-alanyl-D-alanine carboxypeptidase/D-alanyl-D-alanine-endopeptidase (penicillin-binding protein 4)